MLDGRRRGGAAVAGVWVLLAGWTVAWAGPASQPATTSAPADDLYRVVPVAELDATLLALRERVAANPGDRAARLRLAFLQDRYVNDHAAALEQVQAVLAANPRDFAANELAAQIHGYNGQTEAQFEALLAVLAHDDLSLPRRMANAFDLRQGARAREDRLIAALADLRARSGKDVSPTTAAFAGWYLAAIYQGLGREADADALRRDLGLVRDWAIIGPFKNERNAGFQEVYGPEQEIDFDKTYPGRQTAVRWRALDPKFIRASGVLNFGSLFYPADQALGYALTYIKSPTAQDAVIRIGAEDSLKVWVNDRLALAEDTPTAFSFDQYAVPVRLHAGWNKVLVKVGRRDGGWSLALRVTDPAGAALTGLAYSAEPQATPDDRQVPAPTFAYRGGLVEESRQALAADPANERALLQVALAQDFCGRSEQAVLAGEKVLAANPRSALYRIMMADLYLDDEKPEQAQDQLFEAQKLDPRGVAPQQLIARFYVQRGLKDKALKAAEALARQVGQTELTLSLLRAVYDAKGFDEHRRRLTEKLLKLRPEDRGTLVAWAGELSALGQREASRAVLRQVGARWPTDPAYRALLLREAEEARDDARVLALNAEDLVRSPDSFELRMERVRLLSAQQDYDAALAVLAEAEALSPQNPRVDQVRGQIALRRQQDGQAVEHWQKALAKNPDDTSLREYVEFLQPEDNKVFAKFEVPDAEVEQILKRRVNPSDYPKAHSAMLLDFAVTQLFEDASSKTLEHQIIQVFNDEGRDTWKTLPLNGSNPRVKRARVIKPDGTEVEATEIRGGQIHFARLQAGDLIEVKVATTAGDQGWLSRHWTHAWSFQSEEPFLRSEYVLVYPPSRQIKEYLQSGAGVERTESEFEGQKVVRWVARDVGVPVSEPNRPPLRDLIKALQLTTIPDWSEVAAWEWSLIKEQFKADEAVKAKVAELTAGKQTREEKVQAIADFVMQNIQYKQDYVTAIMGMKPHSASQVLARQRGDCKDKATLLITMLREVGIPAEYVSLLTRDRGTFRKDLPTNQCNHAIVYVPGENGQPGRYIDGTALWQPYNVLPVGDQGVTAIHLWDGKYTFKQTPVDAPEQNTSRMAVAADVSGDGTAQGTVSMTMSGNLAPTFRVRLQTPDRFREVFEQLVGGMFPGGGLVKWSHSNPTDRYADAFVKADVRMPHLLEGSDDRLIVRVPENLRLALTRRFAPQATRSYDIWLASAMRQVIEQSYALPSNLRVVELPQDARLETPWMSYERRVTQADGQIKITSTLDLKAVQIPQAGYDELRKFCNEVDRLDRQDIVLAKEKAAATQPAGQ